MQMLHFLLLVENKLGIPSEALNVYSNYLLMSVYMECPVTWGQDSFKTNQGSVGNNLSTPKDVTKYTSTQLSHPCP